MPQPKWYGKSLVQLCMDSVIKNMGRWCAMHIFEWAGQRGLDSTFVSSHFDLLPSFCLEYMTEWLIGNSQMEEEFYYLLLNSHFKVLDLRYYGDPSVSNRVLRLATTRCPELTTMSFDEEFGCRPTKQQDLFHGMFLQFENLQVLNLSYSNCASFLPILGAPSCKAKLKELKMESCYNLNDAVLEEFCIGQRSIQKLSCFDTDDVLTEAGISFVLRHLLQLLEFKYDKPEFDILKFFKAEVRQNNTNQKPFCLTSLTLFERYPYLYGNIQIMTSMCPSTIKLDIPGCWFREGGATDAELLVFQELKEVKSLALCLSQGIWSITFHGGVAPLIKVIGRNLEKLELYRLSSRQLPMYMDLIFEYCPNLCKLSLHEDGDSDSSSDSSEPAANDFLNSTPLKKLKKLQVTGFGEKFAIPPRIMLLLLSSPYLTEIFIFKSLTLTDEILVEAYAIHNFKHLQHLNLSHCSVSHKSIGLFMHENNPLNFLRLHGCVGVDSDSIECWKIEAKEKNWKLSIYKK